MTKRNVTSTPLRKAIELGCPGHFICAKDCRFRRHTQVGNYRVSTVGDLFTIDLDDPQRRRTKRETVGSGEKDFFETMVFKTSRKLVQNNDGCGCREVLGWCELECIRYATAGEAQRGHEKLVRKYARMK